MENRIVGLDILNFTIWEARQLNETYHWQWIGTSRNDTLLIIFIDVESCIEHFLNHYTKTDQICATINDGFYTAMVNQIPVKSMMPTINEMLHLNEAKNAR